MRSFGLPLASILLIVGGCSCGDDSSMTDVTDTPGSDMSMPPTDGAPVGTDGPVVASDASVVIMEDGGFTWTCVPTTCAGHNTECGNCTDDDGDGFVDSRDPECLGPCDNTEGPPLTTGVGGEGGTSCNRDCYFDYGNGSGGGDCRWDTLCDPLAPDDVCPYEESELGGNRCPEPQPENCLSRCRPLTPNGCDCFGCCTFDALAGRPDAEGGEYVWLGSGIGDGPDGAGTCTLDSITDTEACHPCVPVEECSNDCGRCELCLGRTEIPDDCFDEPDGGVPDGGTYETRCDPGVQACGLPDDPPCETGFYCVTGCCVPVLI